MPRPMLSRVLLSSVALGLLALAGCNNDYRSQSAVRMRLVCSQHQSWCDHELIVLERLPSDRTAVMTPLLEIQRFHCDDMSGGQGTSLRLTAHVRNYGTAQFDSAQDVNLTATLSEDGRRVLKSATGTLGAHTHIAAYSQAQPNDPNADIAVPIDFGDASGNTVREITVSFDPNSWVGLLRLNGGALSWPVWNNATSVSTTPIDLTANGTCVVQVP